MGTDRVEMMSSGMAGGGREEPACVRPLLVGLQHMSCHLLLITVLEAFGTVTPQAGGEGTSPGRVCGLLRVTQLCGTEGRIRTQHCLPRLGSLCSPTLWRLWNLGGTGVPWREHGRGVTGEMGGANF